MDQLHFASLRIATALRRLAAIVLLTAFCVPVSTFAQSEALLKRAREAAGGDAWNKVAVLAYDGIEDSSGMQGRTHRIDDLKMGRVRSESDFGVVHFVEVQVGVQHWRQDMTGGVHLLDSNFAREATITDEWLARRAYLKPSVDKTGADKAIFGPAEQCSDSGKVYAVLSATPAKGQKVELWFDADTGLLARSVRIMPTTVQTVTYSNYKTIQGLRLPHSIVTDEGNGNDVDKWEISEYQLNPAINDQTFQPPRPPDDASVAGGKATVPIEVDGYVTLDAQLNGKGPFTFLFDTGGHAILTPEAATLLGLHPEGAGSAGGAGSERLPVQYAHLDRMEIGGVTLKNQTFLVIPLQYNTVERGERPVLAGILGLELLERLAARLDYRKHTMTFWPRDSYRHISPGQAVPITFTDDMPLLRARMNGVTGDFALDTGNGGSLVVQHVWAEQHGLAGELKRGVEMVSFGSGGASRNWASRISDFELANQSFHHIIGRYAEDKVGAFSSRTEAGNLGTEILANFTLDLDYAHSRIWFEPTPGFTPSPFPRSGMSLYKRDPKSVVVVNVIPGGPAAEAGLRTEDTIVTVAGKSTPALSSEDLGRIFTQAPGTRIPIVYSRDRQEASTVLVLKELLP